MNKDMCEKLADIHMETTRLRKYPHSIAADPRIGRYLLANDPVLPGQHLSMSDSLELAEDELSEALKHIEHAIAMSVVYGQATEDGDDDQGTTGTD